MISTQDSAFENEDGDERFFAAAWRLGCLVRLERVGSAQVWHQDVNVGKLCGGPA